MRFRTLQQAFLSCAAPSVVSAGKMNGCLFHLCSCCQRSQERHKSLSVAAAVGFMCLNSCLTLYLDAFKVLSSGFTAAQKGMIANITFPCLPTVCLRNYSISEHTWHIFRPIPVILMALCHAVKTLTGMHSWNKESHRIVQEELFFFFNYS